MRQEFVDHGRVVDVNVRKPLEKVSRVDERTEPVLLGRLDYALGPCASRGALFPCWQANSSWRISSSFFQPAFECIRGLLYQPCSIPRRHIYDYFEGIRRTAVESCKQRIIA